MTILVPPSGQQPHPGGYEIYNFDRGVPRLHNYGFRFSFRCAEVKKRVLKEWSSFDHLALP